MVQFDQLFMVLGVLFFSYMLADFMVKVDYRVHRRRKNRKIYQ